ncbi:MAG: hypothetical protein ACP5HD_10495 [Thermoproteus sp.]
MVTYLTGFNPYIYPRPFLFKRCCGAKIYRLRTFLGHYRNPQRQFQPPATPTAGKTGRRYRGDPLKWVYPCQRIDGTTLLDALAYEYLYYPYVKELADDVVITL